MLFLTPPNKVWRCHTFYSVAAHEELLRYTTLKKIKFLCYF